MVIKSIKTEKITPGDDILKVLDKYLDHIAEGSIVVVTSKIVSLCEDRVVPIGTVDKSALVKQEAELYIPPEKNKYNMTITIKKSLMVPTAGIDESNGNGYYVLWPKDPQKSANLIRRYLSSKYNLKKLGVIITDSRTSPLRWGTTGVAIAHSGFRALNNYIGKPDIFGRPMHVTKANLMDALASAAVVVMGEGSECTPLALIRDLPMVAFQSRNPTKKELEDLSIDIEDDIYGDILKKADWQVGESE